MSGRTGEIFPNPKGIKLYEPEHRYLDSYGNEYTSWSKMSKMFQKEFNADLRSSQGAAKYLRERELPPTASNLAWAKTQLLNSWDKKRDNASDYGSMLHKMTEVFRLTGNMVITDHRTGIERECNSAEKHLLEVIYRDYVKPFYRFRCEQIFFNEQLYLAGTADHVVIRANSTNPVVDIYDFKTNYERGIEYTSKYGNWLTGPLQHMEDCNYNKYSLQLSMYALWMEHTYGYRVGRLAIIYIDRQLQKHEIPVPYLKHEAMAMCMVYDDEKQRAEC